MKHTLNELLSVIYSHYARGVRSSDPEYQETPEHRRLVQARIQAGANDKSWYALLDQIEARFPDFSIQDGSLHLPTGGFDAGYSALFWLSPRGPHEKNHVLGFLISFLVPYFVVYSSAHVAIPDAKPPAWSHEIRFTFSPDEEPYARAITEEILAVFPGYEPLPPEIGNVVVPDVAVGVEPFGKATVFHCLFTDHW